MYGIRLSNAKLNLVFVKGMVIVYYNIYIQMITDRYMVQKSSPAFNSIALKLNMSYVMIIIVMNNEYDYYLIVYIFVFYKLTNKRNVKFSIKR